MSMIGNFRSLPEADIEALFERPGRVVKVLYGEEAAEQEGGGDGFLSLFRRGSGAPAGPDTWEPSGDGEEIDVDKAWHGIHYLLTGTDWMGDEPENFIVQGGREIGKIDVGYGPARALSSLEVKAVAAALDSVPPDELARRFDPGEMTRLQIYPEIWSRDSAEDDSLGYLIEYYGELRDFMKRAAERGHALLVYLN